MGSTSRWSASPCRASAASLGLEPSSLQWVVSGYILGYGGLLLLGGRAADLLGRRRVLLGGLAVFLVASFVGGLANDGNTLIATRFIKGAAAAFTAPAVLSIITTTFAEGPVRNKALSIYAAVGASGWSLGLVFGGALTELGWRYTFFMPVPIALAILLLLPRYLDKDEPVAGSTGGASTSAARRPSRWRCWGLSTPSSRLPMSAGERLRRCSRSRRSRCC